MRKSARSSESLAPARACEKERVRDIVGELIWSKEPSNQCTES